MNVLFSTLFLSQADSGANFRNKYPVLIFLLFLALVFGFTSFFLGIMQVSLNILDVLALVLFAAILSYALVYHVELFLYLSIIACILSIIIPFLPVEYKIYYERGGIRIFYYFYMAIFLLPPIYDLYMYYNNKQTPKTAAGQIPAQPQSAGSSRKRHK